MVGASASGVQIADELNRAGREVVLAVGRHTRMPRRYRGMDIFWWLESTGRLARTIDEVPDPEAARREPSLQLVGRADPDGRRRTSTWPRCRRAASGWPAASTGSSGRRATVRRRPGRPRVAAADARDAPLPRRRRPATSTAPASPPRCWQPRPAATARRPAAPERLDLRARGHRHRAGRHRLPPGPPWLRLPLTAPDGSIRQHRGVTAAPGVYVVGQRFQHRRDSGFIDGARHDARASWPTCDRATAGAADRREAARSRRHEQPTTWSSSAAGSPAPRPPCSSPGPAPGSPCVDRGRRGSDTLSTHALMRAGVLQLSRWGLLDQVVAAGTPPIRRTLFHYADGEPVAGLDPPQRRGGRAVRAAPHLLDRILVDAAAAAGVDVRARDDGDRAAARRRRAGSAAVARAGPAAAGVELSARDHGRRRRHPVHRRRRRSGAPIQRQGRAASAVLYRYFADVPARRLRVGVRRRRAAAGLIPTNDGATCVFVGTTPARMRACAATGAERAFAALLAAAGPALGATGSARRGRLGRSAGWAGRPGHRPPVLGAGLGAGRRRRLLQGPDHHARHDRRAARRRAARRRAPRRAGGAVAGGRRAGALPGDPRPTVAQLFEATEAVAAYDWDPDGIRTLLRAVSAAMSDEVDHLGARSPAASAA